MNQIDHLVKICRLSFSRGDHDNISMQFQRGQVTAWGRLASGKRPYCALSAGSYRRTAVKFG